MDRFGSSGMGRMNGKNIDVILQKQMWTYSCFADFSNGLISCVVRDGPWNWWCF